MGEAAPDLVYVYEVPGAQTEANEWSYEFASCECGRDFVAVVHMPTYQEQGRLRCPNCMRYRAYLVADAQNGRVH